MKAIVTVIGRDKVGITAELDDIINDVLKDS